MTNLWGTPTDEESRRWEWEGRGYGIGFFIFGAVLIGIYAMSEGLGFLIGFLFTVVGGIILLLVFGFLRLIGSLIGSLGVQYFDKWFGSSKRVNKL